MRKNSILPLLCLLALLGTLCMLIPGAAALTVSAQPKDGRTSTQARVPSAGSGTAPAPAAPSSSPPPTQQAPRAQEKPWSPFYDWMKEQRALADENERNDPETGTFGDDSPRTKARVEDVVDDVPVRELERTTHYQVVFVMPGGEHKARLAALEGGFEYLGPLGDLPDHYRVRRAWDAPATASSLRGAADAYHAQAPLSRELRGIWGGDALRSQYPMQWNLHGRFGDYSNRVLPNLGIEEAWKRFGVTGVGVNVGIADEGVDTLAGDIRASHDPDLDVIVHPEGKFGTHGTGVAGLIAAQPDANCITGGSPNARYGDIPIINHETHTDGDEGVALASKVDRAKHGEKALHIIIAAWGPSDSGFHAVAPGPLAAAAMEYGEQKGVTYVFAGGNGGGGDFTVLDGYASFPVGVIAVGAIDHDGGRAFYSETGASLFCVAPSSGRGMFVIASSRGAFGCDMMGSGTSFAAPQIASLLALADEAHPRGHLSSRDHQHIISLCSDLVDQNNDRDMGLLGVWRRNGAGYYRSNSYGFGMPNASVCLSYARAWQPQAMPPRLTSVVELGLTEKNAAVGESLYGQWRIQEENTPVRFLEAVQFNVTYRCGPSFYADKPNLSGVAFQLTSPSGMVSDLLPLTNRLLPAELTWAFTTFDFWQESPIGLWTLSVINENANGCLAHLDSASLIFRGSEESVLDAVLPGSANA